ncbi:MAG: low temperature requirement protein A [Atopobiaceae bacterium]|nr:low temperature requirement protein A [Atopobiaceae bacterium]
MRKRPLRLAKGVSNLELFYDLIFVYGISVVTSLCHHIEGGFLDLGTWLIFLFSFLVILQIWFSTTLLMNRYGDRSVPECVGLFVNMFLLYFLANGVRTDWHETSLMFNLTWAGVLVNLAVQWLIKLRTYSNLDDTDRRIMRRSAVLLAIQASLALVAALLPYGPSEVMSWVTLLFGMVSWRQTSYYRKKPGRFDHVAERCSLLTIIAFGEMIVGISAYVQNMSSVWYPIGVFTLVVGLFLIYIFEHDHMLDHHAKTDGLTYMFISSWLIVVIGNLTVAIEYMPVEAVDFMSKSAYLSACLVLYLLTSFLLGRYNKPEYRYSARYIVGRIAVCVLIVVVGLATSFDPVIGLGCHVLAVWAAFGYEWVLWRRRSHLVAVGRSLGLSIEEMEDAGYSLASMEGQQNIMRKASEQERE